MRLVRAEAGVATRAQACGHSDPRMRVQPLLLVRAPRRPAGRPLSDGLRQREPLSPGPVLFREQPVQETVPLASQKAGRPQFCFAL